MKPFWLLTVPLGLFSLTIGFDARFWPAEDVPVPDSKVTAAPHDLIQCRSYLLPKDESLNIDLPKNVVRLRLLANAAFDPGVRATLQDGVPPVDFPMEIEYEVLDAEGGLLLEGRSVLRSRINGHFDRELNRPVVGGFFKESEHLPGISHEFILSLRRFQGRAAQVRVRLGRHAREIHGAVLRSYALIGREEELDQYLWERTSPTWRERLTRANLYPPELVSESERQNLLRHRWSAVPPTGVDGQDFEERILCLIRDFHLPADVEPVTIWEGHPVGPHWKGSIPLPGPAGRVRLVFHWLERSEPLPDGTISPTKVRWHAPESGLQHTSETVPAEADSIVEMPVRGGLLEIESPHLAEVVAWWRPDEETIEDLLEPGGELAKLAPERISPDGEVDITPDPVVRKAYRVDPEGSVEFAVSHLDGEPTPVRLIVQQLADPDAVPLPLEIPALTWEFLNSDREVLHSGVIEHAAPLSEYDRFEERTLDQTLAESATRYFSVPPGVTHVRLSSSSHTLLVSLATRPPDLPFVRVIGDDLAPLVEEDTDRVWFPLIPDRHAELADQRRAHIVFIRRPPPETPGQQLPERGRWESFQPTTAWTARRLLVPWTPPVEVSPELHSLVFQQLQQRVEYRGRFPSPPGVLQVSPRVVWSGASKIPQTLSVFIDGALHDRIRILSPHGQSPLAPVTTADDAEHRIELRADEEFPVSLSGLESGIGPARLERFALRWTSEELEFDYEKLSAEEELLQMKLFQTEQAGSGSEISCELTLLHPRQTGPFERWTFCRRIFQLQPAADPSALVLDAAGERVEAGRLCVIPLGTDLPPGQYRLRIRRESGDVGYLLLFRRRSDDGPRREFEIVTQTDPPKRP